MYEKPQYLTKDGYKRLGTNPHTTGTFKLTAPAAQNKVSAEQMVALKKRQTAMIMAHKAGSSSKPLSDKAAKLIAGALKGMLNS